MRTPHRTSPTQNATSVLQSRLKKTTEKLLFLERQLLEGSREGPFLSSRDAFRDSASSAMPPPPPRMPRRPNMTKANDETPARSRPHFVDVYDSIEGKSALLASPSGLGVDSLDDISDGNIVIDRSAIIADDDGEEDAALWKKKFGAASTSSTSEKRSSVVWDALNGFASTRGSSNSRDHGARSVSSLSGTQGQSKNESDRGRRRDDGGSNSGARQQSVTGRIIRTLHAELAERDKLLRSARDEMCEAIQRASDAETGATKKIAEIQNSVAERERRRIEEIEKRIVEERLRAEKMYRQENEQSSRRARLEQQSLAMEADYCASLQKEWRAERRENFSLRETATRLDSEARLCADLSSKCDDLRGETADAKEDVRRAETKATLANAFVKEMEVEISNARQAASQCESDLDSELRELAKARSDARAAADKAADDIRGQENARLLWEEAVRSDMQSLERIATSETTAAERESDHLRRKIEAQHEMIARLEMKTELLESERERVAKQHSLTVAEAKSTYDSAVEDRDEATCRLERLLSACREEIGVARHEARERAKEAAEAKTANAKLWTEVDVLNMEGEKFRLSMQTTLSSFKSETVALGRAEADEARWREAATRAATRETDVLQRCRVSESDMSAKVKHEAELVHSMHAELALKSRENETFVAALREEIEETLQHNGELHEQIVMERRRFSGRSISEVVEDGEDEGVARSPSSRRTMHMHISRRGSVQIVSPAPRDLDQGEARAISSERRSSVSDQEDLRRAVAEYEAQVHSANREQEEMRVRLREVEAFAEQERVEWESKSRKVERHVVETACRETRARDDATYRERLGEFARSEARVIEDLHREIDDGTKRAEASVDELVSLRRAMLRMEDESARRLGDAKQRARRELEIMDERQTAAVDLAVEMWAQEHARETEEAWKRQESVIGLELSNVRDDLQTVKLRLHSEASAAADGRHAMRALDEARRRNGQLEDTIEEVRAAARLAILECEDEVASKESDIEKRLLVEESAMNGRLIRSEEQIAAAFAARQKETLESCATTTNDVDRMRAEVARVESRLEIEREEADSMRESCRDAVSESTELREALARSNASMTSYQIEMEDQRRRREEQIAKRAARLVISEKRALEELRATQKTASQVVSLRKELALAQDHRARLEKAKIDARNREKMRGARRLVIALVRTTRQIELRALLRWYCNVHSKTEEMLKRYQRRLRRANSSMQHLRQELESRERDDSRRRRPPREVDGDNSLVAMKGGVMTPHWRAAPKTRGVEIDVRRESGVDSRFLWRDDEEEEEEKEEDNAVSPVQSSRKPKRVSLSTIRRLRDLNTFDLGKKRDNKGDRAHIEAARNVTSARRLGPERDVTVRDANAAAELLNSPRRTRRRADHKDWKAKSSRRRGTHFGTYVSDKILEPSHEEWRDGAVRALRKAFSNRRSLFGRRLKMSALDEAFRVVDHSSDGFVDERELSAMLRRLDIALTPKQHRKLFEHIDRNRDGHIEVSEFRSVLQAACERVAAKKSGRNR
eukprot:g154.t1